MGWVIFFIETGRSLTQKIADREQKIKESNKLQKQKVQQTSI